RNFTNSVGSKNNYVPSPWVAKPVTDLLHEELVSGHDCGPHAAGRNFVRSKLVRDPKQAESTHETANKSKQCYKPVSHPELNFPLSVRPAVASVKADDAKHRQFPHRIASD